MSATYGAEAGLAVSTGKPAPDTSHPYGILYARRGYNLRYSRGASLKENM